MVTTKLRPTLKLIVVFLFVNLFINLPLQTISAQDATGDPPKNVKPLSTVAPNEMSAKLKSAIGLGEIRVELKPMIPTESVRGIAWSPKGTKIALEENGDVLSGDLRIGEHDVIRLQFEFKTSDNAPDHPAGAVLRLDLDHDQKFNGDEIQEIEASHSRGKFWYSATATIDLPVDAKTKRPYPISLWLVVDPDDDQSQTVIRWSRRGWHEGQIQLGDKEVAAVITDADSDGLFTKSDAWGLGQTPKEAYSPRNSSNKIDSHAWLDSVAYHITDIDQQGRQMTLRAIDLGVSEAEDRERKDPYAADKKYARSETPVKFVTDFEQAKAMAKKQNKRIVVDFVTTWCGPCKTMDQLVYTARPVVERSSEFIFVKLDGDEQKELNDEFEVKGYPTLILLDPDGDIVRRATGYQGVAPLLEFLKQTP